MPQKSQPYNPMFILSLLQLCIWKNGRSIVNGQTFESLVENDDLDDIIVKSYLADISSKAKRVQRESAPISLDPTRVNALLDFIGFANWSEFEAIFTKLQKEVKIDVKNDKLTILILYPKILHDSCFKYLSVINKALNIHVELHQIMPEDELTRLLEEGYKKNAVVSLLIPIWEIETNQKEFLGSLIPFINSSNFIPVFIDSNAVLSRERPSTQIEANLVSHGIIELFMAILTSEALILAQHNSKKEISDKSGGVFNLSGNAQANYIEQLNAEKGSRVNVGTYIENQINKDKK